MARDPYEPADPTLREFARKLRPRSPRTIEEYVREVEIFGAFLDGRLSGLKPFNTRDRRTAAYDRTWAAAPFERLPGANFKDLTEYIDWLYDRRLSAAGVRRKLAALRAYFGYLRAYGHRADNPTSELPLPKLPQRRFKTVPVDEIKHLRAAGRPEAVSDYALLRNCAIVSLLYSSGIRRAELVSLNAGDIDLDRRVLTVIGKGNKQREVVFDRDTATLLQRYRAVRGRGEDDAFFLGRKTGRGTRTRISYDYVRDVVEQFARRAGIEAHVTPHMLRHSIATHLIESGMDLNSIRDQLGHENVATTSLYLHGGIRHRQLKYDEIMDSSPATRTDGNA